MDHATAARRLHVPDHEVVSVAEHPAGHIVTLADGYQHLVSPTVARPYIPDVDDVPAPAVAPSGKGKTRPAGAVADEPAPAITG